LERLTRKPRRKRHAIAQPKLLEWVECMDPEMQLSDIPDHSQSRIEDLEELIHKVETKENIATAYTTGDLADSLSR
jgi:hypothetical protein